MYILLLKSNSEGKITLEQCENRKFVLLQFFFLCFRVG